MRVLILVVASLLPMQVLAVEQLCLPPYVRDEADFDARAIWPQRPERSPEVDVSAPEEGFIACINGKAMFRENGRRWFLNQPAASNWC